MNVDRALPPQDIGFQGGYLVEVLWLILAAARFTRDEVLITSGCRSCSASFLTAWSEFAMTTPLSVVKLVEMHTSAAYNAEALAQPDWMPCFKLQKAPSSRRE